MRTPIFPMSAALLFGLLCRVEGNPPMEQSFPDGVSVRIESVQIGGAFSYAAESPVEHGMIYPDGKASAWQLFNDVSFKAPADDQSLYVWFRISALYELWDALLIDKDGQMARNDPDGIPFRRPVSRTAAIMGFQFPSFPRSQKSLRLRLVRGGEWHKQNLQPAALEFVISNPAPLSETNRQADSPSLVHDIDGTWITLEGLATGISDSDPDDVHRTMSRVRFTADDGGKPSRVWGIRMLDLTDSLGNSLDDHYCCASNVTRFNDDGLLELLLFTPVWLSGNPCALTVEFVRVDELPVSQRTTVKNLPVIPEASMVGREKKQQFEIRAEEFPDSLLQASYYTACDQPGNILRLALELDKIPEGFHCGILEVKDDTGKPTHRVFGNNAFKPDRFAKREAPRYLIDIPDTSKTVEITFGIQKIRRLSFRTDAVMSSDTLPTRQ